MPKQIHTINNFHGGVNLSSDARDIHDSELADSQDIAIDSVGSVKLMGATDFANTSTNTITTGTLTPNFGLFTFGSDYKRDGSSSDEFIILNADAGSGGVDALDSDGWGANFGTSENINKPVYYISDGNVRISDYNHSVATQWVGYVDRNLFASLNGANDINAWVKTTAFPTAPTAGKNLISTPVVTTDTSDTANNDYGEYEGYLVNPASSATGLVVAVTNAINLRTGIVFNNSIEDDGDAVEIADTTSLVGASSITEYNYRYYAGGTDGTYGKEEDVYPLFLDNNILVGGKESVDIADGRETVIKDTSSDNYVIDESNSFVVGVYLWEAQRALISRIKVLVGVDETNFYTFTVNGEEVIEGWNVIVCEQGMHSSVTGSPSWGATFNVWSVNVKRYGVSGADAPQFFISGPVLAPNPGATGYTPGEYRFFYSWLYDDIKQESNLFEFENVDASTSPYELAYLKTHLGNIMFSHDVYLNPKPGNTYGLNSRISGSRVYYKKEEDDDHYLLFEYDFVDKGVRFFPESESVNYSASNIHANANNMDYGMVVKDITPEVANVVDTYKNLNSYIGSEIKNFKAKTAIVHNRRAYLGNIKGDAVESDRMVKSMVNKFDVFVENQSNVDVAIRDGENIVKLETYADRILQYKEKSLYIINVAEGSEFLEDVYRHHGVKFPYHVVLSDKGVVWFNEHGVYFYNGNQVINLLEKNGIKIIDEKSWSDFITADSDTNMENCSLAYIPKKHQIVIKNKELDVYVYDFVLQAWTRGVDRIQPTLGNNITNFVISDANDVIFIGGTNGHVGTWQTEPQPSQNFMMQTKDVDFGMPAVRKKIYKIQVTYKSSSTFVPNINVKYAVNGARVHDKLFADGTNYSTNSINSIQSFDSMTTTSQVASFKPATSSEANNIYSISLHFSIGAVHTGTRVGGTGTSITLASGASSVNDYYNNMGILITGGTGAGNFTRITDYTGSSKSATVPAWTATGTAPAGGSTYAVGLVNDGFEINDITIFYRLKTIT